MKKILIGLIIIIAGLITFGYLLKNNGSNGDRWIGIGVLLAAFVLMPLFLYSRFKNKDARERMLNFDLKEKKGTDNQ